MTNKLSSLHSMPPINATSQKALSKTAPTSGSPNAETGTSEQTAIQEPTKASRTGRTPSGSEGGATSPMELVLERLREQIAEVKERIAEVEAKLLAAELASQGETSAAVDALRSELNGLQGQLSNLMGAYNDALKEGQKTAQAGSLIDTYQ